MGELPPGADLDFRHSGWRRHRAAIYRAMIANNVPAVRLERFAFCGHATWVYRTKDEQPTYKLKGSFCHDRFCLPCQVSRAQQLSRSIYAQLPPGQLAFITLTIRHSDKPLAEQLRHLYTCFRKLRTSKLWRTACDGGCAFLEVKMTEDRRHWHPHLHVIAQTGWMEQADIAATWHRITKTSYIVDIRAVEDRSRVRRYVTAYGSKPLSFAPTNNPPKLQEAIAALRGRRLCFTFGTWRKFKLIEKPDPQDWEPICPLSHAIHQADAGDSFYIAMLAQLTEGTQCRTKRINTKRGPPTCLGE